MWYLPGTSANVILMWDIIHLMSKNVTLPLHLGVRRSQRYYKRCRPMNGKIFWLKTPAFSFLKTCLYSSSTCFWVKASAGRKSSTCSQRAKNLNSATLRVFILSLFNNTVQNLFREKSWNIWPLLWGEVCQCDLHNSTVEVLKPNQTGGILYQICSTKFNFGAF